MAKILLVEDDNNLREIYEARLQAEGYDIISAQDGEEALVKAKQEKPDLVISDVMMPRISGFEMLDILRNTEGLKNTKVIMLTALGQAEDKTRADSLGADRYLVKSQVTLEDIVKAADELLAPEAASTPGVNSSAAASVTAPVASVPVPEPTTNTTPSATPTPVATAPAAATITPAMPTPAVAEPSSSAVVPAVLPVTPAPSTAAPAPTPAASTDTTIAQPATAPVAEPSMSTPAVTVPSAQPTPQATEPEVTAASTTPTPPEIATSAPATEAEPAAVPTPEVPEAVAPEVPAQPVETSNETSPEAAAETTTSAPEELAKSKSTAAEPSTPEPNNDKLIADAVRNLTADLNKVGEAAPPQPTPAAETSTVKQSDAGEAEATVPVTPSIEVPKPETPNIVAEPATTVVEPTAPAVSETPAETTTSAPEATPVEDTPTEQATPTPSETPESEIAPTPPEIATSAPATEAEPAAVPTPEVPEAVAPEVPAQPVETSSETPTVVVPQQAPPIESTRETKNAASTADEQAAMQAQINDFINQQKAGETQTNTPTEQATPTPSETPESEIAPTPPEIATSAPATEAEPAAVPTPEVPEAVAPAPSTSPVPETQAASIDNQNIQDDDVSIAHKKIIQPPVEPISAQPDLSELLAKEGITSLDDVHNGEPSTQPTSPHQPGHVITPGATTTPNTFSADDPNNIAL